MAFLDLGAIPLCTMVKAARDVFVSILKQRWDVTAPICLTGPWGSSHGSAPAQELWTLCQKRGKNIYRSIYIYMYVCMCCSSLYQTPEVERDNCLVLGTDLSKDSSYVPESSASVKAFHLMAKEETSIFSPKFTPLLVKNAFSMGSQVHSCGSCRKWL